MKKLIIGMTVVLFFSITSCLSDHSEDGKNLKGKILFDMDWKAQQFEKNSNYFWIVPVQVENDTLFANYLDYRGGDRNIVSTKLLYDLGYSIGNRPQVAYLIKGSNRANNNLDINHIGMK